MDRTDCVKSIYFRSTKSGQPTLIFSAIQKPENIRPIMEISLLYSPKVTFLSSTLLHS